MLPRRLALTAVAALVAVAACSDSSTAPDPAGLGPASGAQAGRDTTIGSPSYVANVRIRGRVLEATWQPGNTAGDSLVAGFAPMAGAHVTIYRNVLVDGQGVSVKVGEATTNADGAYDVARVPGGPYVISLNVTPDRFYGETYVYALGTKPEITADIRVWRP
jgi:hypothetical protein